MNKPFNLRTLQEHPFWKFSVKIYAIPSVKSALLKLQNERSLNVNIILFCCWYSFCGQGRLAKTELGQLLQAIYPWHERIVMPLRRLRQNLNKHYVQKPDKKLLYDESLETEVFSELIEQHMLAQAIVFQTKPIRTTVQKITDTCKNIIAYSQKIQITMEVGDHIEVAEIISAIYPQIENESIVQCCQQLFTTKDSNGSMASQLPLDL
jgi:uncharacterized protein (TIGR02444 family)